MKAQGDLISSASQASGFSRRHFLKIVSLGVPACAGGFAGPVILPGRALGRSKVSPPSERITMGMIGLGSMGLRHVRGFLEEKDCQIVAVCDVDVSRREEALKVIHEREGNQGCVGIHDFRELLTREDVDTVCIAVPDHWHSIISIEAARAKKDIYGEKPLALTISEGRSMVEAVRRYGVVWETGSWQRSTRNFRFACELVRNRTIGTLRGCQVGIGKGLILGPQPEMSVPEGFDYERWLGPAPWAPYTEKRCHWNFRWILDYSGGQVTDWGAHHVDIAQWGMDTDGTGPLEVQGEGLFPEDGLWDAAVEYQFECAYANGITMRVGSNNFYPQGVRFEGDRGWVHVTRSGLQAKPESLLRYSFKPDEIRLPRPAGDHRQGHRRDFLDCVKRRTETVVPIEIGHRSATVCHLGNIAMKLKRPVRWDPVEEIFPEDAQANRMLSRAFREPYTC